MIGRDRGIPRDIVEAARPSWRRTITTTATLMAVLVAIGLVIWANGGFEATEPGDEAMGLPAVIASFAFLGFVIARSKLESDQGRNEQRLLVERAQGQIAAADAQVAEAEDFASIWKSSQLRLDFYHQLALEQSRRSFLYGILAATAGLAAAVACAVAATGATSAAGSVVAGGVGVLTTALGGYVGATFMRAYVLASRQLQAYFAQAAESWRYLSAERLVEQVQDPGRRDAAVAELALRVVDHSLPSPQADAQ